MTRWRITIEYDGGAFVGWQRQANGLSVQEALEEGIVRLSGERVTVFGAGRTDTGVHATGQVAHFDLHRDMPERAIRDGLNQHLLPQPVAVVDARPVGEDFHARFSAIRRAYRYRILNRRAPPVLDRGFVWRIPVDLDVAAMHEAAQMLVGRHDFTSFRAAECQAKDPVKTLERLAVTRHGDEIHVETEARSFLHNQVRIMVGTLKQVGEGRWDAARVAAALAARDRTAAGLTAPPQGLCLVRVDYRGEEPDLAPAVTPAGPPPRRD